MKMKELFADQRNWTQGVMREEVHTRDGSSWRYCLLGGAMACYSSDAELMNVVEKMHSALEIRYAGEPVHVAAWNDDPVRTHADILNLVTELDI